MKKSKSAIVLIPEAEASQEDPIFTMGSWKGLPQWRCVLCPWDTLDGEAAMLAHYQANHAPPPPPPAPVLIQAYDRFGNPIGPFVGDLRGE